MKNIVNIFNNITIDIFHLIDIFDTTFYLIHLKDLYII